MTRTQRMGLHLSSTRLSSPSRTNQEGDFRMKVGLVLEGGGMRGLYTAGVLDAFLEAGIKVDGVVSVSAGALFGVNYLSNQPKRALRYNKRFMGDRRYMSFWSWLTTGNSLIRSSPIIRFQWS